MDNNLAIGHIRRVWRNILIFNLVVAFLAAIFIYHHENLIYNLVFGPFDGNSTDLASNAKQWYVSVTTDETYDTKLEASSAKFVLVVRGHKIPSEASPVSRWLVSKIGSKHLLIEVPIDYKAPIDFSGQTFIGCIDKFPGDTRNFPGFYPASLNTMKEPQFSGWFYLISGSFVFFISAYYSCKSIFRFINPKTDNSYTTLKKYGEPNIILDGIVSQWTDNSSTLQIGKHLSITNDWIIHTDTYDMNFIKISDIRWVYGNRSRTSSASIPFASKYVKMLWPKDGDEPQWDSFVVNIWTSEASESIDLTFTLLTEAAELIEELSERQPNIMLGYSDQLSNLWTRNRKKFLEMIEDKELMSQLFSEEGVDLSSIKMSKSKPKK